MVCFSCARHERIIVYPPPRPVEARSLPVKSPQPDDLPVDVPIEEPLPPNPTPTPEAFLQAEEHFKQGEYQQAIEEYQAYLDIYPDSQSRERVLFNIALSHALAPWPVRNFSKSEAALNLLLEEYPNSAYRNGIKLIFELIAQIRQLDRNVRIRNAEITRLEEELNRLKEIDLKRRPTRPAE